MKITDEMVIVAIEAMQEAFLGDADSFEIAKKALTAVAPLIRAEALEEAARVAGAYKDECDMRARRHQKQSNHRSQDAALDMFVAARDIEDAIRALKDKPKTEPTP